MQFTTLIAAVAALAVGTQGRRLGQFRVYGAEGCSALNYGFYTVDDTDAGSCHTFTNNPTAIAAVDVESLEAGDCNLNFFTDDSCAEGETSIDRGICGSPSVTGATWGSWSVTCSA